MLVVSGPMDSIRDLQASRDGERGCVFAAFGSGAGVE